MSIYGGAKKDLFTTKGNGILTTIEKTFSLFESIHVSSSAEVIFHQSEEYRIVITVDENLLPYLKLVVNDLNELFIGTKNGSYNFTLYKVDVFAPLLEAVQLSGAGSLESKEIFYYPDLKINISGAGKATLTIDCSHLLVNITGAGKVTLIGKSERASIYISGAGKMISNEFEFVLVDLTISGAGYADIGPSEFLSGNVTGAGTLKYWGNPQLKLNMKGSSRLLKEY